MKKYGHTGTLFKEGNKFKWSRKHEYCIECLNCDNKHKGKGLCTKCFDKQRLKKDRRQVTNYLGTVKFMYKARVLKYLDQTEKKKSGPKEKSKEHKLQKKREWYKKNRKLILLREKAKRMEKNGVKLLVAYFNGKKVTLPFESIDKPTSYMNNEQEWLEYRKKQVAYDLVKDYYLKKNIKSCNKFDTQIKINILYTYKDNNKQD